MTRSNRGFQCVASVFAAGAIVISLCQAGRSQGNPSPQVLMTTPVIVVRPVQDAGGLFGLEQDTKQPLNLRLTTGMIKYLNSHANGRFKVVDGRDTKIVLREKGSLRVDVEGEVSHVDTLAADAGPYLWTGRVVSSDRQHRVLGQWAGVAQTFRYLSSNLRHDPRFSEEGLMGELGDRIIALVTQEASISQDLAFKHLVTHASELKRIQADVMGTPPSGGSALPVTTLVSGQAYQVKIASLDVGTAYLVGIGPDGHPKNLFIPEPGKEIDVAPGRSALLPAGSVLKADEVTQPRKFDIVVLVRRQRDTEQGSPAGNTLNGGTAATKSAVALNNPHARDVNLLGQNVGDAPVQVLDGGWAHPLAAEDSGVARLLKQAAADPVDAWTALRVTIHIEPAK